VPNLRNSLVPSSPYFLRSHASLHTSENIYKTQLEQLTNISVEVLYGRWSVLNFGNSYSKYYSIERRHNEILEAHYQVVSATVPKN